MGRILAVADEPRVEKASEIGDGANVGHALRSGSGTCHRVATLTANSQSHDRRGRADKRPAATI
jgi:hypothetical protein